MDEGNNSRKRSVGLKFVQCKLTSAIIKQSATAHSKVHFDKIHRLPSTALREIFSEEDLEALLESKNAKKADPELPTLASNVT